MPNRFLAYLQREHARLDQLIAEEAARLRPDELELASLKKQKLLIKDQIVAWRSDIESDRALDDVN